MEHNFFLTYAYLLYVNYIFGFWTDINTRRTAQLPVLFFLSLRVCCCSAPVDMEQFARRGDNHDLPAEKRALFKHRWTV